MQSLLSCTSIFLSNLLKVLVVANTFLQFQISLFNCSSNVLTSISVKTFFLIVKFLYEVDQCLIEYRNLFSSFPHPLTVTVVVVVAVITMVTNYKYFPYH